MLNTATMKPVRVKSDGISIPYVTLSYSRLDRIGFPGVA